MEVPCYPYSFGRNIRLLSKKSALFEQEKVLKTVLKSSQKSCGVLYILKMTKNAIFLAKNAGKNQTFLFIGKSDNFAYRKLRLPFSNANSEAGMRDITAIIWCVITKSEKSRHLTSFG